MGSGPSNRINIPGTWPVARLPWPSPPAPAASSSTSTIVVVTVREELFLTSSQFLAGYPPGAAVLEGTAFPGDSTFDAGLLRFPQSSSLLKNSFGGSNRTRERARRPPMPSQTLSNLILANCSLARFGRFSSPFSTGCRFLGTSPAKFTRDRAWTWFHLLQEITGHRLPIQPGRVPERRGRARRRTAPAASDRRRPSCRGREQAVELGPRQLRPKRFARTEPQFDPGVEAERTNLLDRRRFAAGRAGRADRHVVRPDETIRSRLTLPTKVITNSVAGRS